jgi:hypothetical protein
MLMTIKAFSSEVGTGSREENASTRKPGARNVWHWLGYALLALGLWFAGLVGLTILAEPTRAVIVFTPDRHTMMATIRSTDVALLDGSDRLLSVAGRSPGFVTKLYASGAWLVLPSRMSGCITPPRAAKARNPARG